MRPFESRLLRAAAAIAIISSAATADAKQSGRAGGASRSGSASRSAGASSRTAQHHSGARNNAAVNGNRSTHANRNVNANRSANVNVNHNVHVNNNVGRYGYGAHPVARAATVGAMAVTTGAVIGSMYHALPSNCATVVHSGGTYHHCGSAWYQSHNGQYVAVTAP
jgi:hypothetical protein